MRLSALARNLALPRRAALPRMLTLLGLATLLGLFGAAHAGASGSPESGSPESGSPESYAPDPWRDEIRPEEASSPPVIPSEDTLPQWGRGPFEVSDLFLLSLNRLSPWARSPETLGHLEVEAGVQMNWVNTWMIGTDRVLIDGESRQLTPWVRVGLFDRIELGIRLPFEWRGGGQLDGFIEAFHGVFGLPNGDRGNFDSNRFRVTGVQSDGTTVSRNRTGTGWGALVTEARALLTEGEGLIPAAAATLRLRFPTGRRSFDFANGVDASIGLDLSWRLGRNAPVILYSGFAYLYHGRRRVGSLVLNRNRGFFYLGLEVEVFDWMSIVAHGWVESKRELRLFKDSRLPGVPDAGLAVGEYVSYISGGLKFEPVDDLMVEVGILQNLADPEITADFGVLFNVRYRF